MQHKHKKEIPAHNNEKKDSYPKWLPIAVVLLTALLYTKAVLNGFVDYDDNGFVLNNPYLRDFSWHGVKAIFTTFVYGAYSPLTTVLYFIIYHFFRLNPLPYHLLNVLVHLLNVWLVFKVTLQLSGKKITALIVMFLFAVHPMNAEPVAWVSSLKDVLFAFFYLLSLSFYLRYLESGLIVQYYFITIVFFIVSLMSKSAAVTLPVLLTAIDIYKGRMINIMSLLEKIPFFLLSVLLGILTIFAEKSLGALNTNMAYYGFINRIFLLTSAIASYIIKVIAPLNLSAAHYLPELINGRLPLIYYGSLLFLLLILWLALRKSSFRKEIIFGSCFFIITISVMLQIIQVGYVHTCERYAYITYIGVFYIIGQYISNTTIKKWRYVTLVAFSVLIIMFCFQTEARIAVWKNDITLSTSIIEKEPDAMRFYFMRANSEKLEGDIQTALQDYTKCIQLDSTFEDAYFNRATVFDESSNIQLAIKDYSKLIRLNPKADAFNNRGWEYYKSGDMKSAMLDYDKAILLDSTFSKAYFNRASIKVSSGDFTGAIEDYNSLLRMYANDKNAYYYRGKAYLQTKDTINACKDWKKAAELGNEHALELLRQYCK